MSRFLHVKASILHLLLFFFRGGGHQRFSYYNFHTCNSKPLSDLICKDIDYLLYFIGVFGEEGYKRVNTFRMAGW